MFRARLLAVVTVLASVWLIRATSETFFLYSPEKSSSVGDALMVLLFLAGCVFLISSIAMLFLSVFSLKKGNGVFIIREDSAYGRLFRHVLNMTRYKGKYAWCGTLWKTNALLTAISFLLGALVTLVISFAQYWYGWLSFLVAFVTPLIFGVWLETRITDRVNLMSGFYHSKWDHIKYSIPLWILLVVTSYAAFGLFYGYETMIDVLLVLLAGLPYGALVLALVVCVIVAGIFIIWLFTCVTSWIGDHRPRVNPPRLLSRLPTGLKENQFIQSFYRGWLCPRIRVE